MKPEKALVKLKKCFTSKNRHQIGLSLSSSFKSVTF